MGIASSVSITEISSAACTIGQRLWIQNLGVLMVAFYGLVQEKVTIPPPRIRSSKVLALALCISSSGGHSGQSEPGGVDI